MQTQFNQAGETKIEGKRSSFTPSIHDVHDFDKFLVKLGQTAQMSDISSEDAREPEFSKFLLGSPWITTGVFTVSTSCDKSTATYLPMGTIGLDGTAFFSHSLWIRGGFFGLQC